MKRLKRNYSAPGHQRTSANREKAGLILSIFAAWLAASPAMAGYTLNTLASVSGHPDAGATVSGNTPAPSCSLDEDDDYLPQTGKSRGA
jgi:hypothetical protein